MSGRSAAAIGRCPKASWRQRVAAVSVVLRIDERNNGQPLARRAIDTGEDQALVADFLARVMLLLLSGVWSVRPM